MRIGIDISQIVYGTGVSNYTKNLVQTLLRIDKDNRYVLFGGAIRQLNNLNYLSRQFSGNFEKKFFPLSPFILDFLWNKLHKFPIENFVGNVDIFHSSDWTQPPAKTAKLVTTIHDLVPILYPETSHPKIVAVHKRRLEWVKKEVDRVIAVSEATKRDIVKYLGISPDKISVIYEAVNPIVKRVGDRQIGETRRKYKLPKEYLLAVGADQRKNIEKIAKAINLIPDAPKLVVVGRKWKKFTLSEVEEQNIIWLGYVEDGDLCALYSGAQALIYVSLYEGFGLPILNAFACGISVVTSNISSMPEVAGEAAVLVNPEEVDDIAQGIKDALKNRDELIKKGYARVKQFSWEKAARGTLKVYQEVAG